MDDKKKTPIAKDIKSATTAFIDYMYNEGVVAYNDSHLSAYAKGYQKPDYKDICGQIIRDTCNPLCPNSLSMVTTLLYDLGEETDTEIVKASIDEAIKEFAEKANCHLLAIVYGN